MKQGGRERGPGHLSPKAPLESFCSRTPRGGASQQVALVSTVLAGAALRVASWAARAPGGGCEAAEVAPRRWSLPGEGVVSRRGTSGHGPAIVTVQPGACPCP